MNWDVTISAKDDHVLVLVVAIVADSALGIILCSDCPHVTTSRPFLFILQEHSLTTTSVATGLHPLKNLLVLDVALALLFLLNVLEEILLQLGRLAHVQQDLVEVFSVPSHVPGVVLDKPWLQLGLERKTVLLSLVLSVGKRVKQLLIWFL